MHEDEVLPDVGLTFGLLQPDGSDAFNLRREILLRQLKHLLKSEVPLSEERAVAVAPGVKSSIPECNGRPALLLVQQSETLKLLTFGG